MEAIAELKQDSDYKFWLVFDQAAVGIGLVLPDGTFTRANPELCKMLGYSEFELKDVKSQDITHPDDVDDELIFAQRTLRNEMPAYRMEKRFTRPDGRLVWALLSATLERDAAGQPLHFIVVAVDISERKAAQEELMKARDRYLAICDHVRDLISVHDLKGNYLAASPASLTMLGYAPEELVGTNALNYFHPDDLITIIDDYNKLGTFEGYVRTRYRVRHKSGEYVWFETYTTPIAGLHGVDRELLSISRQVPEEKNMRASLLEEKKRAKERSKTLESLALRDELTSLMNRRALDELLSTKLASRRTSTYPFGCLLVDLDHFGELKDNYGQAIAEDVLRRVGQMLVEWCRTEDFVGRYEGDKFIILLPNTDASGTVIVGERLIQAINTAYWPELPPSERLSISVGGTCITRSTGMSLNDLLSLLESQLAHAKEIGRNRLVLNAREIARHLGE
jgi:diguanylate cyclase (GGDEF)-like protein/PAS domain S-box-containing protein